MFGCGMPAFIKDSRACFSLSYEEMVYFMAKATLLKSVEVPIFSLIFLALNQYAKTCQQKLQNSLTTPCLVYLPWNSWTERFIYLRGGFSSNYLLDKEQTHFSRANKNRLPEKSRICTCKCLHVSNRVVDFFLSNDSAINHKDSNETEAF